MAVAAELRAVQAGYLPPGEQRRRPQQRDILLLDDPFFTLIDPLVSRPRPSDLPSSFSLPGVRPYMTEVYEAAGMNDVTDTSQKFPSQGEVTLFSNPTARSTRYGGIQRYEIEAGRNAYREPKTGNTYMGPIITGNHGELAQLNENVHQLLRRGKYTNYQMHVHPRKFLPLHSLDDWLITLQQREEGTDTPVINATTVLGDRVQVTAVMTAESHPLLTDADIEDFRAEWEMKFNAAGGRIATEWARDTRGMSGKAHQDAKGQLDAYRQYAHDQVTLALLRTLNPQLFISTNMVDHDAILPEQLIPLLRERQKKIQPHAA